MKSLKCIALGIMVILGSTTLKAQDDVTINDYKYVVIPMQFHFQEKENEYLINSRVKHLLDKEGFNTVMKDQNYPSDLAFNRCLALYAGLKSGSNGFFSTHTEIKLQLRNCHNKIVFETQIGKSRAKDMALSYKEALRDAFRSFQEVYYGYNGHKETEGKTPGEDESQEKEENISPLAKTLGKTYMLNGTSFIVQKIKAGYLLQNKRTEKRKALLSITDDKTILYNSADLNGKVTVEDNGDFKVEYFNQDKGEMDKKFFHASDN